METNKKNYETPRITEVKLEDKRVVAMAACNRKDVPVPPQNLDGGFVTDEQGNRIYTYDPS